MASSIALNESRLPVQTQKVLPQAIRPHLLAYCPRTDLFAVVNSGEVVDVYRVGGQRAFNVKRKSPSSTVVGLEWIRNGKCLAIALSTGNVDIVSGETGKIVRHGGDDPFTNDDSGSRSTTGAITCLGWGTTWTGTANPVPKSSQRNQSAALQNDNEASTEDWYDNLNDGSNDDAIGQENAVLNDLPRQLAFIDVESILPRLSPIPTRSNAGGRYDMFATQSALDDYFNSMQRKNRSTAEVMLIGHDDGHVRLVIDDILEVGLPPKNGKESPDAIKQYLQYASHPQSPCHALLCAEPKVSSASGGRKVYQRLSLGLFDIPLLSSGGSHFHLIVSRTAQIRDLCSYISYSILCAKSDWTTHTNLPSRFMENINETLEEKGEGTLEQNLFHLAMTGNFSPTIMEWLRDELAERGHKRWDHAMTTLFTELSKIFQTNLLPVLERCIVVATNLRGLARYYEGSRKFDVPPSVFTEIIDALCMQQLLVHEAIQILGEEQRQFRAFSKWLRHEIDLAAADPESISAKDMAEREVPNMDYPRILTYLEGALTQSRLKPIVHAQQAEGEGGRVSQQDLVEAIQQARCGNAERMDLLSLHTISTHLNNVCKAAHLQILRWQNSATPSVEEYQLQTGAVSDVFDTRMICTKQNVFETVVLCVPLEEQNKISIHSITKDNNSKNNNTSTLSSKPPDIQQHFVIHFPSSAIVKCLKFLNDTTMIILLSLPPLSPSSSSSSSSHHHHHHLIHLPYTGSSSQTSTKSQTVTTDFTKEKDLTPHIIHSFPTNESFVPAEMVVSGKKGAANITVVGADYRRWRIYDLEDAAAAAVAARDGGAGKGRLGGGGGGRRRRRRRGDGNEEGEEGEEEEEEEFIDEDDDED